MSSHHLPLRAPQQLAIPADAPLGSAGPVLSALERPHRRPALLAFARGRHKLAQHVPHRRAKERVPTLVLLHDPARRPQLQHRIRQHLHQCHAPAHLSPVRVLAPIKPHHQIPHAQQPRSLVQGHLQHALAPQAPVRRRAHHVLAHDLPELPVPLGRRHEAPVRNDATARVRLVPSMRHVRAVSAETGQHVQAHRPRRHADPTVRNMVLPEELIQGHVLHLPQANGHPAARSALYLEQLVPAVELVDLALPLGRPIRALLLHLRDSLETPGPQSVQGDHLHERVHHRQPQRQVHRLEHAVLALAHGPAVKLLEAPLQQVYPLALRRVLAHLVHSGPQHLAHAPRALRGLGRVLRDVLHHGPQVQAGPPVNVAQVPQQDVRLVAATEPVVPRKAREPGAFPGALDQMHLPLARPGQQLMRKAIPALRARRRAHRARVALLRLPKIVPRVPPARLHQRRHELPHGPQVHRVSVRGAAEHRIQHLAQPRALRRAHVHLHVVRADLGVPHKARLTVVCVARVPLRHQVLEVRPELPLLQLLAVLAGVPLAHLLGQRCRAQPGQGPRHLAPTVALRACTCRRQRRWGHKARAAVCHGLAA